MSEPLVIVGNGMAAARLCEELAQRALGRYAVAVIGEEPRLAYNRVLLSSVLAGEIAANDISLKPASWWSDRGVTLGAVAQIGNAFGMKVIAWSQNLTIDRAAEVGATLVSRDEVFREADVVTIHLVLSGRTRGLVGAAELALMKPTSRLINTSRGPIVVEADLIAALKDKIIAGAAIDVFDQEPLPLDHPFRALPNLLATPHIGYVSRGLYARFYQDTVTNICRWLDGQAAKAVRV
jgi:hypothetical protein